MESSSFCGSSKRAKAPGNTTQNVRCSVDGCNADLSLCRDYHRRHKVCEMHSKTPKVTIGGREQRFCQQCSRFHSLMEFDDGKRSCRKRLDGHNRRRRKPQLDSISRICGPVFPTQSGVSGTTLLSFSNPQILQPSGVTSSWAKELNYTERQNTPAHTYEGVNQLQFMEGSNCPLIQEPSARQPVLDSDRALSLLSSTPPVTREFGLNHLAQTEPLTHARSIVHNLQYGGLGQYPFAQDSKPVDSAADSGGSDVSTLHFPEMLHHGTEGSSTTGAHQTLTFIWE